MFLNLKKILIYVLQVEPHVRRIGDFLIGPKLAVSPVKSILHCLGRKDGTDRYYLLKILHLGIGTKESQVTNYLYVYIKL